MQYYHQIITEKSFEFLKKLGSDFDFILIGGWAVFLYSRALKSKDIDIIVDYENLAKLKEKFEVVKNDRLKKYEIKTGEFDVDIYAAHYSKLGVDIQLIEKSASVKEGFRLPQLEILFLLKLFAWKNRQGSPKGEKDELDIFSLAFLPEFDWKRYIAYAQSLNLNKSNNDFLSLLKRTAKIPQLDINEQKMAKNKKAILKNF